MIPQNQPQYLFNLGVNDPLLANRPVNAQDYLNDVNREIERLNAFKQQIMQTQDVAQPVQQPTISTWDEINKEISSLTEDQQAILAKDENYLALEQQLQFMIQQELVNSVKNKVAATAQGKELLERQLKYVKERKGQIVEEANKEIETFKKFQIAVQANPNLTYAEFVKSIK